MIFRILDVYIFLKLLISSVFEFLFMSVSSLGVLALLNNLGEFKIALKMGDI